MQKTKAYIGVDPGQTGACVLISENGIDYFDWPGVAIFATELSAWTQEYDIQLAMVERVSAMPKQGVSSTFNFGRSFGQIEGVLAALRVPYDLRTPQKWQKGLVLPSDGADAKERSLAVARRLYPNADWLRRKKDHNRADALLMAHVARKEGE